MARRASAEALSRYSHDLLQSAGADLASAEAATWAVLHASLLGVDSHGVRLLPWYADCLKLGLAKGSPDIKVSQPRRATALVDAANDAGGKDNISVVLARVRGPAGPARSWWPFRR